MMLAFTATVRLEIGQQTGQNRKVKLRPANPQSLDELMVVAVDYAEFALRNRRQVPPSLIAATKRGPLYFTPDSLENDRAKDDFADMARLICIAYDVSAAVMILESWLKMASEGEALDLNERPSEAFDRQEVVMVMGEAVGIRQPKILKIVRTDAGGFFGLTEMEGLPMDQFQGRFAQLLPAKRPTPELIEVAGAMLAVKGLNESMLRGGRRR